jgi:hypothetical protein
MHSSAAVAVRALLMLACVVAIPAFAIWGCSWSELVKKFQKFELPAVLNLASASTPAASDETPRTTPPKLSNPSSANIATETPARLAETMPSEKSTAEAARADENPQAPEEVRQIETKLRRFGATYYVLEAWGSEQQLYRFYCKMAVDGHTDYTHCFESIESNPIQAMLHVLKQIETWREEEGLSKAPSPV